MLALALLNATTWKYMPNDDKMAIPINNIKLFKSKLTQKYDNNIEVTISPTIEVKNNDVSLESYLETSLVTIWYNPRKKAADRGSSDLGSNTDNPGRRITRTPIKPIKTAIHVFDETFSFKIKTDKITIITGAKEATLCASAKCKCLNDKIKNADSVIDKMLLNNWVLIFLLFQKKLFFFLLDSMMDSISKKKYLNNNNWNIDWLTEAYFWKTSTIENVKYANIAKIIPIFSWDFENGIFINCYKFP